MKNAIFRIFVSMLGDEDILPFVFRIGLFIVELFQMISFAFLTSVYLIKFIIN